MAGLLYAGFDYGATANLPGIWTSASGVAIIPPPGGRFGGGCARFDAATPSTLSADRTWTGTTAQQAIAVCGFDLHPVDTWAGDVTIAHVLTSGTTIALLGQANGALIVRQDGQDVCSAGPGLFSLALHAYVELSIDLEASTVVLRVNTLTVAAADLPIATSGDTFATFVLGGGSAAAGRFDVDDVYLLDGNPQDPISLGSRVIDNASFLGNIVVQALFPTADGYRINSDPGYTPWTPAFGVTHFDQVNENPPDGGITNESTTVVGTYNGGAHTLNKYDTFQFTHPQQGVDGFGRCSRCNSFRRWPSPVLRTPTQPYAS
jgi:hypothetical protein